MDASDERLTRAGALIFDCDGTLVDSAPVYAKAWAAGFADAGGRMDEAWYLARNGLSEHVLMEAFERHSGLTLDRAGVVARMRAAYVEQMGLLREIALVAAVARAFHGRKPMAVASGGPAALVRPSLERLGLAGLFDAVVTLDDVGVPKPAPDLFLHAAGLLRVAPAACLVFEDSDTGLEAAHRAGMAAIDVRARAVLGERGSAGL